MYRLQYYIAQFFFFLIAILPTPICYFIARRFGDLTYLLFFKRRKIAIENVSRAFGQLIPMAKKKKHARKSFQNVAMSIYDLFNIEKTRKRAKDLFRIKGMANYRKALGRGKGVVLVTSHLGSWEYLAFLFFLTDTKCSVIVKDIKNPLLNTKVNEARRKSGLNPISKNDSIRGIFVELKKNNTVAILIDQWAGPEGLWMPFFGEPTSTTSIPARLAEKTGCTLLPAFCIREPGGKFTIDLHKPVIWDELDQKNQNERKVTKILNQILESKILAYSGQWPWGHRRWKPKPKELRGE